MPKNDILTKLLVFIREVTEDVFQREIRAHRSFEVIRAALDIGIFLFFFGYLSYFYKIIFDIIFGYRLSRHIQLVENALLQCNGNGLAVYLQFIELIEDDEFLI